MNEQHFNPIKLIDDILNALPNATEDTRISFKSRQNSLAFSMPENYWTHLELVFEEIEGNTDYHNQDVKTIWDQGMKDYDSMMNALKGGQHE
jgi:hypothetical protein